MAERLIEYKGVEVLRDEHVALKDVDWQVDAGEFVYLLGRVGSGKTSLLKTVYGEVPVGKGEARVLDYDLRALRRSDIPYLRRRIGIVFQDFQLLTDRTAWANLDFVLAATGWRDKEERDLRIDEVLRQVGMQTKAFKMPHQLSGGEQQRIAIARALLNKPGLILADEPTGNLDGENSRNIFAILRELAHERQRCIIVVTHDMELAQRTDRIVRIQDGKIAEG